MAVSRCAHLRKPAPRTADAGTRRSKPRQVAPWSRQRQSEPSRARNRRSRAPAGWDGLGPSQTPKPREGSAAGARGTGLEIREERGIQGAQKDQETGPPSFAVTPSSSVTDSLLGRGRRASMWRGEERNGAGASGGDAGGSAHPSKASRKMSYARMIPGLSFLALLKRVMCAPPWCKAPFGCAVPPILSHPSPFTPPPPPRLTPS